MVELTARYFVDKLIAEKLIEKKIRDWYIYSYIRLVETLICMGTFLFLAILLDKVIPTLLFVTFFYALRRRTGGFHCKDFLHCYIASDVMLVVIMQLEPYLSRYLVLEGIGVAVSSGVIFAIGTVNHPNMSFDFDEISTSKKMAREILALELFLIFIAAIIGIETEYISYMSLGIMFCSVLLLLAKAFNQEVKNERKESSEAKNT